MAQIKDYFIKRFKESGRVWGQEPSLTAVHANKLFRRNKVESILVPGSGYGRHTIFFNSEGYDVEGVEFVDEAIKLAKEAEPEITYYKGSVFDMPFTSKKYDAIYCFSVLHLFMEKEREVFINNCYNALKENGMAYFSVVSYEDGGYSSLKEVEPNTFMINNNRSLHFFTEDDLKNHFKSFETLDTGTLIENLKQGEDSHKTYTFRYIFARKN